MLHFTKVKSTSVKNKNNLDFSKLEIGSFFNIKFMYRTPDTVYFKTTRLAAICLGNNSRQIIHQDRPVILIDELNIKSV